MGYPSGYWPPGYWPLGYLPIAVDEPQPGDEEGGGDGWTPAPLLDLPTSPEAVAWSAFARLVRESPELRGVETTFRTWDGSDGDAADPTAEDAPWIRFSPSAGKPTPYAMGILATPVVVHADLLTAGTNAADNLNLWGVLHSLLLAPGFLAEMRAVGVSDVRVTDAPAGVRANVPKYEPQVPGAILAVGTIELRLYRRTG
jgi:hypothetical protein